MLSAFEVLWLAAVPASVLTWYHTARQAWHFDSPAGELPPGPHPQVIFSIAARKLTPILTHSIASIRDSCASVGFTNYRIKLVVDHADTEMEGADVIVVPVDFTCKSRYKARALHYALRFLPNSSDAWTLHLDEDALVTPQCVCRIVTHITSGGKPIANGPSVFPYDGNPLTFYAEAQRHWTFYWLMDQQTSGRVHWLNGSNLLIRSDIEQQVGWDFENCFISEDARFGYEATKKLGKQFGWYGGLTIENPPGSVSAVIKQRKRWFFGSILNLRYVPKWRLPRRLYSITAWIDGLILALFFFILISGINRGHWFTTSWTVPGLTVTAVLWIGRYQLGVFQNLRHSRLANGWKALLHIGAIPLAPVTDIICNLPAVLALVQRPGSFEITAKRK